MWISQRSERTTLPSKHNRKMEKKSVDSAGAFGALMTDLSKAFDCLHHELLIAKLDAYGFDIKSGKLIQQYLSNRKQRVNAGNAHSSWKKNFVSNSTGINP